MWGKGAGQARNKQTDKLADGDRRCRCHRVLCTIKKKKKKKKISRMARSWQSRVYRSMVKLLTNSGPVWPSGKAVGWQVEGPRFDTASALLSLQKLWFVDTVL